MSTGTKRPGRQCLGCGATVDTRIPAPGNVTTMPRPGAILICAYCQALSIVQEDGSDRRLTPDEMADVMTAPEVREALAFAKSLGQFIGANAGWN